LTVKNLGDYTADLKQLLSGSIARVEGPFGRFSFLEVSGRKQIWVAGGIGITPFLSMARSLKDHPGYQVHLFYCTNTRQEAVLLDELYEIGRANSQLKVISHCSDVSGRIDAVVISRECGGLDDCEIFICGPAPMMKSLKDQFIRSDVSPARLHSEEFALL
jgi:predicted ferric reductase